MGGRKSSNWVMNRSDSGLGGFPGPAATGQALQECGRKEQLFRPEAHSSTWLRLQPGEGCGESAAHPAESDRDD